MQLNEGLITYLEDSRSEFNRNQIEAERAKLFLEANAQVLRQGLAAERQLVGLAQKESMGSLTLPKNSSPPLWPLAGFESLEQGRPAQVWGGRVGPAESFRPNPAAWSYNRRLPCQAL